MNEKLKKRIDQFNRIGYQDNSNRIIVATLKPDYMALVWKDKTTTSNWKLDNLSQLKKRLSGWVLFAFEKNYEDKLKRLKSN